MATYRPVSRSPDRVATSSGNGITDPSVIDTGDPNNNLTRGGVSMPLYPTSQDVFPGVPGGPGKFFRDAAGNIVDAAGNIMKACRAIS